MQYSEDLLKRLKILLAPDGYTPRAEAEACYEPRNLPERAVVTRLAPSPTGFVHIGTIYMALINKLVATQSKGVSILRVEDTDKSREVENGVKIIADALEHFTLTPDEGVNADGSSYGEYAPYIQSQRAKTYLGFAIDLLEKGRAYPCFATPAELEANYKQQQAEKVRPGYYGKWAIWREQQEDAIQQALNAERPFVLRFRSQGSHVQKIQIKDVLKGNLELAQNDLDVPLIKSDINRLPTYHLAHLVDDFLMRINIVLRGDEWLPSTPLHIEFAKALGIPILRYAHFAPINIMDGSSKRKLSKRKDPEADIKYFIDAGYPQEAILEYLVGLANSNFEDWRLQNPGAPLWAFPFTFEKWSKARGALLDVKKLDDVSKNHISGLPQETYWGEVLEWTKMHDSELYEAMSADRGYTSEVLIIERDGEKNRKDVAKWSDIPSEYGYFFDNIFVKRFQAQGRKEFLSDFDDTTISEVASVFLNIFDPNDNREDWFDKLKAAAETVGFTADNKAFKQNPEQFNGNIADFARIIRVLITGKNRTPDLWTIIQIMGERRAKSRLPV
ncbi:MAG: glutamate--tRNA ligase family protein [bacterium]|nr:glutamate--tRNA ligase family protein [bacterium]